MNEWIILFIDEWFLDLEYECKSSEETSEKNTHKSLWQTEYRILNLMSIYIYLQVCAQKQVFFTTFISQVVRNHCKMLSHLLDFWSCLKLKNEISYFLMNEWI